MNRDQKAATIEALATEIEQSQAVFAVDYRGITVPQAAELRGKLREAEATFRIVKNSLTERAADQVGAESLKELLAGPTALTFVRGDAALAAKALADYARTIQLLPFKGGIMDGNAVDAAQITAISKLPSREALYGQLVGVVASPVTGLVRTLNALLGGLAVALGQVRDKKESGEIPAGEPPAAVEAPAEAGEPPAAIEESAKVGEPPAAVEAPAETGEPAAVDEPAETEGSAETEDTEDASTEEESQPEAEASQDQAEEPADEPAQESQDDNEADASAQDQADTAEATKED